MEADHTKFEFFPLEIIFEIFDLLTIHEKKKARLVCHLWRTAIDAHKSVKFCPILRNKNIKYFFKSYRNMDYVGMKNINIRLSKKNGSQNLFPQIKNAELGWKNSEGNIERFLTQVCKYAESLIRAKFSLERISRGAFSKTLSEINWKNMTQFNVTVTMTKYKNTRARKHLKNVTTLLKYGRIPILNDFDFNFCFSCGFSKKHKSRFQNLLMGLYSFLAGHSKTLKKLAGHIYTESQSTIAIPEIPTELLGTLSSYMELQNGSLSMYGVRRFESLLNPALFGTKLKTLDLQIQPTVSLRLNQIYIRRDLFQRDFNQDTKLNIAQIVQRNAKSLVKVSLDVVDLGHLKNCTALESVELKWRHTILEPEDLSCLSHIRLKSFSYNSYDGILSPGLLQLLRQSVETLENVSLCQTRRNRLADDGQIELWLGKCVALKSLQLILLHPEYIEPILRVQFPHLTELKTILTSVDRGQAAVTNWITGSMRDLKKITIWGSSMDIPLLKILLTLPKLKRLAYFTPRNGINDIKNFCNVNPELTLTTAAMGGRKKRQIRTMDFISVNRTNFVNPINN